MPVVTFKAEGQEGIEYMKQLSERLSEPNVLLNPFRGQVSGGDDSLYVIDITPIYPNLWWFGIPMVLIPGYFSWPSWTWWYLPGILVMSSSIIHTKYAFRLFINMGFSRFKSVRQRNAL